MTALATALRHDTPAAKALSAFAAILFAPLLPQRPAEATDIDALLERAAAYEPTQPGYAADLRAAAMRLTANG